MYYYRFTPVDKSAPNAADASLLALAEIIIEGLLQDGHVRLHHFGTFRLHWRKSRGKNKRTMARISFTPAKRIRHLLNPNPAPLIPLIEHSIRAQKSQPELGYFSFSFKALIDQQQDLSHATTTTFPIVNNAPLLTAKKSVITLERPYEPDTEKRNPVMPPEISPASFATQFKSYHLAGAVLLIASLLAITMAAIPSKPDFGQTTLTVTKPMTIEENHPDQIRASKAVDTNSSTKHPVTNSQPNLNTEIVIRPPEIHPTQLSRSKTPILAPYFIAAQKHRVIRGENLWDLAQQYYGSSLLWPHIYLANSNILQNPDTLSVGDIITIPGLQQAPDRLAEQDRVNIQKGYYRVYEYLNQHNSPNAIFFLMASRQYSENR